MKVNLDYRKQQALAYPTTAALILKGGLILVHSTQISPLKRTMAKRGVITKMSKRSLDRLSLVALSTSEKYHSILTLSYGINFPQSGQEVKLHIKKTLQWLNKRGLVDYLWFVEFQDRNAPHIHFLLDFGQEEIDKYHKQIAFFWSNTVVTNNWQYSSLRWDKKKRKLVQRGKQSLFARQAVEMVNAYDDQWAVLRSKDGGARYAMKYAMKKEQKIVPKNFSDMGRFWSTPQHLSLKNLVKTWTYTDEAGVDRMVELMGRDFTNWQYLPKIVIGNTDEICKML